jgi:hypothetical protein
MWAIDGSVKRAVAGAADALPQIAAPVAGHTRPAGRALVAGAKRACTLTLGFVPPGTRLAPDAPIAIPKGTR